MEPAASTRALGLRVEARVAEYLHERGLSILERNVERAGGEIDLIALDLRLDDPEYVFVEVRSRSRVDRGSPLETVGVAKQRHVVRAATAWLVERDLWEAVAVRFDVVGVTISPHRLRVRWIRDAYEA
ncbi:MAG: YraN family protein [Nannocystales bacterium]